MLNVHFSAYHGQTSAVLDLSPYKDGSGRGNPDYVHIAPAPDTYRGKYTTDKNPGQNLGEMYAKEASFFSVTSFKQTGAFFLYWEHLNFQCVY